MEGFSPGGLAGLLGRPVHVGVDDLPELPQDAGRGHGLDREHARARATLRRSAGQSVSQSVGAWLAVSAARPLACSGSSASQEARLAGWLAAGQAWRVVQDVSSPALKYFDLDWDRRLLTLVFNEAIQASSVAISDITLQVGRSVGQRPGPSRGLAVTRVTTVACSNR